MMNLDPVNPNPIPLLMKSKNQWVLWEAGKQDYKGRFAKYPIHPTDGYKVDAQNPENQLPFNLALQLALSEDSLGIGYVLNGVPISSTEDGESLFLVGIDIDKKAGLTNPQLKELWLRLGKPYAEVSPSKSGMRMFCLAKLPIPNRNYNGLEMYTSGRFLTVTGWAGLGDLIECTAQVKKLHEQWFPVKAASSPNRNCEKDRYPPPDTPRNRVWLQELLSYIDPDCDYETYRNVIWGIEAIGWIDAKDIARAWSLGAPERFSEDALTVIRSSFDDRRGGITFGSLVYYARIGGWNSCAYKQGIN
jgi:hypothetical protein